MNMEKPPSPSNTPLPNTPEEQAPPEDNRNLESNDPFEFLGVPQNASDEEINKARRRTQREFHEDAKSEHPRAREFFENAEKAQQIIAKYRESNKQRPTAEINAKAKNETYLPGEGYILQGLTDDPKYFGSYILSAKDRGMTEDLLSGFITTEKFQDTLRHGVNRFLRARKEDSPNAFAEQAFTYIQGWKKYNIHIGIDLFQERNRANIQQLVSAEAEELFWFHKSNFKPFVEGWISSGWQPSEKILDFLKKT